jgi:outer membrane protein assembly factor BamB
MRPILLLALLPLPVLFIARCGGGNDGGDTNRTGPVVDEDASLVVTDSGLVPPVIEGGLTIDTRPSVLQHHKNASRDGVYVDPLMTKTAAQTLHKDAAFKAAIAGPIYAQPLFVEAGPGGKEALYVATEQNEVHALDAATGATIWKVSLGKPVPDSTLPCGNIDPLGVTGTPVIDLASRTMYLDAMTPGPKRMIFALSIDDGSVRAGWPVDVAATVKSGAIAFESPAQSERGALAIMGGTLYVPYGGHFGDCGTYHGWVVGVPLADPQHPKGWATAATGGGIWAVGGIASDGAQLFVATGNTFNASTWGGGEAIIRLSAGPAFSSAPADYFAPSNWKDLDRGDTDLGGSNPVLVDVPGASPAALAVALGKDGNVYVADRTNLGGNKAIATKTVADGRIVNAPAAYTTSKGAFVAFSGTGLGCPAGRGDLVGLKIEAASPPTVSVAWCASQSGGSSPIVTSTTGHADAVVWTLGGGGSNHLRGFDGETGNLIVDLGGMTSIHRMMAPIEAKGRIYVAASNEVFAFTL